ncbi:unnamed protein product [Arctogadus glacialis]
MLKAKHRDGRWHRRGGGVSEEDTKLTADLKRVILEKMEGKYDNDATQKMTRKAKLLDPRYRGDHMKPPELINLKTELVAEMAAAAETTCSSPTRVPISILPRLHLNKVHYPHSISVPIFRCQCCSKSNTPWCTNRTLRSRLPPWLLPRNKHPALNGELITPSSYKKL